MRRLFSLATLSGLALTVSGVLFAATPAGNSTSEDAPAVSSSELARQALEAAAAGDWANRDRLLAQALQQDPNCSAARWQMGCVQWDGKWLTLDDVRATVTADERLVEYRRLRNANAGKPAGELGLARWCRKNDLHDSGRVHWLNVLNLDPQNDEALKALKLRWEKGRLVSTAKEPKAEAASSGKNWAKHWTPLVNRWRRALQDSETTVQKEMQTELAAAKTPAAVAALEQALARQVRTNAERDQYHRLSLMLVKNLETLPDLGAAPSLVRHAVDHSSAEVRAAAAEALKRRPKESYVPLLLARMRAPIEFDSTVVTYPDGGVGVQHTLYQEGGEADVSLSLVGSLNIRDAGPTANDIADQTRDRDIGIDPNMPRNAPPVQVAPPSMTLSPNPSRAAWRQKTETEIAARSSLYRAQSLAEGSKLRSSVAQINRSNGEVNRRIQHVLQTATGEELSANPSHWYRWWKDYWYDYYELEKPEESSRRPVYDLACFSRQYHSLAAAPSSYVLDGNREGTYMMGRPTTSCFPPGTKVWTLTGAAPIEQIKPGDLVLSQDPRSGELSFQPVLTTTVRKPSPAIRISLGSESITATRGHPFWVVGEGWKMAKQLEVGMQLHTVNGAASVSHLEELPPAKPWDRADVYSYNLIVDGFHNYFVGDAKLLAHDNQWYLLDGEVGPLPGLAD